MSFRCNKCGEVFREPELGPEEHDGTSEFWGTVEAHYTCDEICPGCGSDGIEEFRRCDRGECENEALKDDDYCAKCADEADFDFEKIKARAKENVRNDFDAALKSIATPLRKSA